MVDRASPQISSMEVENVSASYQCAHAWLSRQKKEEKKENKRQKTDFTGSVLLIPRIYHNPLNLNQECSILQQLDSTRTRIKRHKQTRWAPETILLKSITQLHSSPMLGREGIYLHIHP
ncbi:hypothetical protein I7I50_12538 [Histoplasma capsulatum G186AR]|uniref:Uncharacterized protein n=1 Tax=Ajellomyces capsulatus TaxID=5037 RepID=A0A8H7Y801_AJECA|nr:hypothetical protein I7I52_11157 [Histoplasma capsulatum]QSS70793.1 hypothetical protein I7I50_12538 [Histoplasma capsulatum G186AR]